MLKRSFSITMAELNQNNIEKWNEINGDHTLRTTYDLDESSVVFDVGGYTGWWSDEILHKYRPDIFIFEPLSEFCATLREKFKGNMKVKIFQIALCDKNGRQKIFIPDKNKDGSSLFLQGSAKFEEVQTESVTNFIRENKIASIELMKINAEGSEFPILEDLLSKGRVGLVHNIQVQFHELVPGAKKRYESISNQLSKTHECVYRYPFLWESWKIKG